MPDLDRIDPEFRALPLAALADAALGRARELGAEHADLRVERIRHAVASTCATAGSPASPTSTTVGLAVRVIVDGVWGFASHVELTPDAGRGHRRAGRRRGPHAGPGGARAGGAGRRAGARRRGLGLGLRHRPVHRADPRQGRAAHRVVAAAAGRRRRRPRARGRHAGAGEQVLRRPGRHHDHPAAGPDRARRSPPPPSTGRRAGSRRWARSPRRPAAAGSTSPAPAGTGTASWRSCPSCWPRRRRRPASTAGRYDLVIDPTNLWLTIHESVGHATEYDRAIGYEAAYAGTSFATPDQLGTLRYGSPLMHVTGDRTVPHGLATIGYDDDGVATTRVGPGARRRAGRLPARPHVRPAAGPGAQQRLRVRRLPAPRADPADGQRVAAARPGARHHHRGADRRRRPRHLRGRRQVLVDRHAALQLPVHRPALLPDRGRPAGRAAARRRLPGHHHRLLGLARRRRRAVDLGAARGDELRQGPAGAGGAGQPRLPVGPVPRRQRAQHPGGGA